MFKTIRNLAAAAAVTAVFCAPAAHAASRIYVFDLARDGAVVADADNPAATLTIIDQSGGTLWTLTADFANTAAKLNDLYFTFKNNVLPSFDTASFQNLAGSVSLPKNNAVTTGGNGGIHFVNNNNDYFGTGEKVAWVFGNSRVGDFTINGLHVNAISNGQSVKFDASVSPVPEPATYALMAAGLLFVGFAAMRRKGGSQSFGAMSASAA